MPTHQALQIKPRFTVPLGYGKKVLQHWLFIEAPQLSAAAVAKEKKIARRLSVTRCWRKNQHNFLQKLSKKCPLQFNIKSAIFHNSLKMLLNIWATFARNFVPKNFQKSPNLVTLQSSSKSFAQNFFFFSKVDSIFFHSISLRRMICCRGVSGHP